MQKPKTTIKRKVAKTTGIPTTSSGRKRKAQKAATGGGCLIPVLTFFAIISLIIIAGCTTVNKTTTEKNTSEVSTTSIQTTEIPTEAPTTEKETEEPTTEMSDALHELYSDNNITLSYYQMHEYKYDPEETRIEFLAENKTDKQLTIQSDIVSVDGISYKGNMSEKVLPNTKGVIEMNVYQKIPVDNPSSIGITINYFDGTLGDTINEHGIVIPEIEIK